MAKKKSTRKVTPRQKALDCRVVAAIEKLQTEIVEHRSACNSNNNEMRHRLDTIESQRSEIESRICKIAARAEKATALSEIVIRAEERLSILEAWIAQQRVAEEIDRATPCVTSTASSDQLVQCGNCRFWRGYGERGECRRFPPKMNTETHYTSWMKRPDYRETRSVEAWPTTSMHDACGEFMNKAVESSP